MEGKFIKKLHECTNDIVNFNKPIIWSDVPDLDVIRVKDTYYMSSTTMHMNPGVPIMKSKDLVNWEIVNYVYDILENNDAQQLKNGNHEYGKGSWASSLRYYNNKFYLAVASFSANKTYIFQTNDIENGAWVKSSLEGVYHDMSLLFDDGKVYMIYGGGDIKVIELTSDAIEIKDGGLNKVLIPNASRIAGQDIKLPAEGAHIHKINGAYYIFLITWPQNGERTQLMFRSDFIDGKYEGKVAYKNSGIAQGGIIETNEGDWYAMLFKDHGAVGRTPFLIPVTWENEWPIHQNHLDYEQTSTNISSFSLFQSDEFNQALEKNPSEKNMVVHGLEDNGFKLPLSWQWNHNPDHPNWSISERPGYLRIKNGKKSLNILETRNVLTQRTYGPECAGHVAIELNGMKYGDVAGIAAFQQNYGFVGVKMLDDMKKIVMSKGNNEGFKEIEAIPIMQDRLYLKVEFDYNKENDKAYFYYSLTGESWLSIGVELQMGYTIPHFMGYRFALFNYATETIGGFVDFDYFRIDNKLQK